MKLEKAIEICSNHGLKPQGSTWGDYLDAIKLLIEAGKREVRHRQGLVLTKPELLPGED